MRTRVIELHQDNMYCNKCLFNVAALLFGMNGIDEFSVNIEKKAIYIKVHDDSLSKRAIRVRIDQALTTGISTGISARRS